MKDHYYFSAVMPVYNKADYVQRALDSVFRQSFEDYELIIVDDKSSDESMEAVEQYFDKRGGMGENVQLVRQNHAGVGAARNNGVAHANGRYLVFLDADDWWLPDYLGEMYGLTRRWPSGEIFGTNYYVKKNGDECLSQVAIDPEFEEGEVVYHEVYDRGQSLMDCMPLTANSYCISRNAFEEAGGYPTELTLGEDLYLWLTVTQQYPLIFLNKALSVYCHDVDPQQRALGKRHTPQGHVAFHLEGLRTAGNPTLKQFLDRIRVEGLNEYYFSEYRESCQKLVREVDWSRQSWRDRLIYCSGLPYALRKMLHNRIATGEARRAKAEKKKAACQNPLQNTNGCYCPA
jgi:glycosyltransferase involved in cell wall biosynthesis